MAFKSKVTPSIGLSAVPTTVSDTVSANTAHTVIGFSLANITTSTITVSAKLNKGASSAFIVKDATVLAGGTIVLVGGDQKVVLEAGDTLTAYCSASSSCDAIVSYLSASN